jgi:hypothetical protein
MKEEIAKNLIKKSAINTSEDFTDNLLLKIEAEKAKSVTNLSRIQSLRYPILAIIGCVVAFSIVLFSGFLPKLVFFDYQVQFDKIPFLVLLSFLLIMGANHIWRLNSLVKDIRS